MHPSLSLSTSYSRAANTLVVALGVLTLIAAMAIISSESAVLAHKETTQVRGGIEALGAVEFVLARREQQVAELANIGDPGEFARWKSHFGTENYGVDYVGNCEVRWKIEPCLTAPRNNPENPTDIEFIANPNPDPNWAPPVNSKELTNDNTYLFRIAVEARYTPNGPDQILARAQGVRYSVINKEGLFRYVIFYAQVGNKGDLEISHEDKVQIEGNIHTNGALYMGSGSLTNDYAAASGPSQQTIIGPTAWRDFNMNGVKDAGETNLPGRVTAVDGIFRLSKQTMYGALNGYPMKSEPAGWTPSAAYDTDPAHVYPRDSSIGITANELSQVLMGAGKKVSVINPYRVKDTSGFVTTGQGHKNLHSAKSITTSQTINLDPSNTHIPLLGQDQDNHRRNDARDGWFEGKGVGEWKQFSNGPTTQDPTHPQGFAGYVRTNETGGRVKKLPRELSGVEDAPLRPLERQQIVEIDPLRPELATPLFAVKNAADNRDPSKSAIDFGAVVEVPGKYLGLALGDGNLARNVDGSGWTVKKVTAGGLGDPAQMPKMGLAIIERPVPDAAIWPGTVDILVPPSSPDYLPYAYGKHWRPFIKPFVAIDVSEHISPGETGVRAWRGIGLDSSLSSSDPSPINQNGSLRRNTYIPGGTLSVAAACREGAPQYLELDTLGKQIHTPKWYNDNWRFFHLKQPKWAGISFPGVKVSYFKDALPKDEMSPNAGRYSPLILATWGEESNQGADGNQTNAYISTGNNGRALTGKPDSIANLIMPMVSIPGPAEINAAVGTAASMANHFSVRYEGFIAPQFSEAYTFTINADDGARMWFDGNLMTSPDSWKMGANTFSYTTVGPLVKNTPYHFVIDYFQGTGRDTISLTWNSSSQSSSEIPTGTTSSPAIGLYQPETFTGFDATKFKYIQCQIDTTSLNGPADQKVGLMLRDGNAGLSQLLSGRDSYIAVLYSPTRGFFTQRRLEPAIPQASERASWFVGGDAQFDANGAGKNANSSGMAGAAMPNNGIFNQVDSKIVYTNWNRPATLKKTSLNDVPAQLVYTYDASKKLRFQTSLTTVRVNSQPCDLGDGNPFIAKFGFDGNDTATKTWVPALEAYKEAQREVVVSLTSTAPFPTFSGTNPKRSLKIFDDVSTNTTDVEEFSPVEAIRLSGTELKLVYSSNSPLVQTQGTPVSTSVKVEDNWVFGVTSAQITMMNSKNWNGHGNWVLAGPVGWFDANNNIVYSSDPVLDWDTCPTPAPANPAAFTQWNDSLGRSFGLNMNDNIPFVVHDVNSYVSSYGHWSIAPVTQYIPWVTDWDTSDQFFIPAQTHSYRPDCWDETLPLPTRPTAKRNLVSTSRWKDDQPNPGSPMPTTIGPNVFLRIVEVSPNIYNFLYYQGTKNVTTLTNSDFQPIVDNNSAPVSADLTGWSPNLLAGPCVQSGSTTVATQVVFQNLSLKITGDSSDTNGDGALDFHDWDNGMGAGATAKYLASQYQVFFGIYDITEDFFSYLSSQPTAACASEEWFYSPREFWSQKRTWEDGTEKDASDPLRTIYAGHGELTNRLLLGKTTTLTLNMGKDPLDKDMSTAGIQAEGIQGYLRTRLLTDAVKKPMSSRSVPTVTSDGTLSDLFNGLLYASRTNRYPWNPNEKLTFNAGMNPWSFDPLFPLPNTFSAVTPNMSALSNMANPYMLWSGVHRLQPYPLDVAPAFRDDDFHHGVRILNASDIYWGYKAYKFGESKTSIVCPNTVYVQGNVNTVEHDVSVHGLTSKVKKHTPLAIFGDSINLESENFNPINYQNAGTNTDIIGKKSGGGILADPTQIAAESTTYVTCFLTHNIPTSRDRVREGQSAAVIDTMLFNENWNPASGRKDMFFKGSLVVMDSRRHTRAFLLDADKQYGQTVFGTTVDDNLSSSLQSGWTTLLGAPQWTHAAPSVYRSPLRTYAFNDDLLTAEGTPPFTPFGITSSGVGGWVRIVE